MKILILLTAFLFVSNSQARTWDHIQLIADQNYLGASTLTERSYNYYDRGTQIHLDSPVNNVEIKRVYNPLKIAGNAIWRSADALIGMEDLWTQDVDVVRAVFTSQTGMTSLDCTLTLHPVKGLRLTSCKYYQNAVAEDGAEDYSDQ